MSRAMVDLLVRTMDNAWVSFGNAMAGLTQAEYHWQPSPDTLALAQLLPPESEDWRKYYAKIPSPPPLSTIEYKVAHVATCKIMYADYAFHDGRLGWRWADLNVPTTLDAMRPYLEAAHRKLRGDLVSLADSDLPKVRKTNWGDLWPIERIIWTTIQHDIYHGAQIRTMRAFYRITCGSRDTSPNE